MSYKIERGGVGAHQRFLKNPDYKGNWPSDSDWTSHRSAHVFENENDAHKWVRENEGEGQLSVVDADTGEKIVDIVSAVKRHIDVTGDQYPGQSDWRRG